MERCNDSGSSISEILQSFGREMRLLIIFLIFTISCKANDSNQKRDEVAKKVIELFTKVSANDKLANMFIDEGIKKQFLKDLGVYYAKLPYRGYVIPNEIEKDVYEVYIAFRQGVKFRIEYKEKKFTVISSFMVANLSEIMEINREQEKNKKKEKSK